ncbi:MAG: hypothetical protein ACI9LY_000132 [Arenicella sp.]|jgi:hypothetical protein
MNDHEDKKSHYAKDSLTLIGATALGILDFIKYKLYKKY